VVLSEKMRWVGVGVLATMGVLGLALVLLGLRGRGGGTPRPSTPQGSVAGGKCLTCGRAMLAGMSACPFCHPSAVATPASASAAAQPPGGTLNVNSAQAAQGLGAVATLAAPAPAGKATLKVTDGADRGKVYTVGPGAPCMLGRAPDCQAVLADAGISGHHAQVRLEGGALLVEDMGSRNGVYVNNVKVKQQQLKSGDLIVIGSTRLVVSLA
jgi:hypothetical protein